MVVCFAECKGHDIEVSLAPAPVPNSFIPVNVHILHFLSFLVFERRVEGLLKNAPLHWRTNVVKLVNR